MHGHCTRAEMKRKRNAFDVLDARFSTVIGHSLSFGTKSEREEIAVPVDESAENEFCAIDRDALANSVIQSRVSIKVDKIFFVIFITLLTVIFSSRHCEASFYPLVIASCRVRDAAVAGG